MVDAPTATHPSGSQRGLDRHIMGNFRMPPPAPLGPRATPRSSDGFCHGTRKMLRRSGGKEPGCMWHLLTPFRGHSCRCCTKSSQILRRVWSIVNGCVFCWSSSGSSPAPTFRMCSKWSSAVGASPRYVPCWRRKSVQCFGMCCQKETLEHLSTFQLPWLLLEKSVAESGERCWGVEQLR